jgi:methyl-accepting chemotaxis protein
VIALGVIAMRKVDGSYSIITKSNFPTVLDLSRVNRDLEGMGYTTYRVIAYPGNSPEAKSAATSSETTSTPRLPSCAKRSSRLSARPVK